MSTEEKQAVDVPEETPKEQDEPKEEEESTATFEPVVSIILFPLTFPRMDLFDREMNVCLHCMLFISNLIVRLSCQYLYADMIDTQWSFFVPVISLNLSNYSF
jgi:hypothetical protein